MAIRSGLENGFLRRKPLFWMALGYCAGIWIDDGLALALTPILVSSVIILCVTLLIAYADRRFVFAAGTISAALLGATVHAARFRVPALNDIAVLLPERASFSWVRGTIIEREWRSGRGERAPSARVVWTVAVDALGRDAGMMLPASGKIRVSVKVDSHANETVSSNDDAMSAANGIVSQLAEGDCVEFRALIEPLPVATLPDSFDYGAYLANQSIHRIGTMSPAALHKISGPKWWRIALRLRRLSGELAARTETLLNGHAEQAGLLNAMVFGRREALSVTDREAFAIAGTAHLLAISGLHIQLVCAGLWRLLGIFGIGRRKSAFGVLAVCAAYCLLTGSSPPAVRSTVMFGAYVAASVARREADPLSALGAAALIVLSYAPHELFSAGFQLSFLAVLSLHALLPAFENALEKWRLKRAPTTVPILGAPVPWTETLSQWAEKSMLVTLAAWLATSPSVAWHMGRFATLALFVNLLALPFLSLCMGLGIVTIFVGCFWTAAGKIVGWTAWFAFATLERINAACAAAPFASIDMPRPHPLTLIAYVALLVWIWIARETNATIRRLGWILPLCVVLLLSNAFLRQACASPELTILDLQHGQGTLIETPNGVALIDTGGGGQGLRIAELLRRRVIHSIALCVLTSDEPGAFDGAQELLQRVACKRVILPRCKFPSESRRRFEALLTEKNIPYGSPPASEIVTAPEGVHWAFFDDGPAADQPAANGSTLCVRVSFDGLSALFAEAKSGASVLRLTSKNHARFDADILRLIPGQFGRWPRETGELIRRAGSKIIVAGTSANLDEAIGVDFESLDATVLSPHEMGSIRLRRSTNGGLEIHAYRGEWHLLNRARQ